MRDFLRRGIGEVVAYGALRGTPDPPFGLPPRVAGPGVPLAHGFSASCLTAKRATTVPSGRRKAGAFGRGEVQVVA